MLLGGKKKNAEVGKERYIHTHGHFAHPWRLWLSFKGTRSHIKNTAARFIHGFQRFDKVRYKGIEWFIFGRRATGYFDLRKLDGSKVHASANVKEIKLLESFRTMLMEVMAVPPNNKLLGIPATIL